MKRQTELSEVVLLRVEYTEGAVPNNGPLFPGAPGVKRSTVGFSKDASSLIFSAEFFKVETVGLDLKITLENPSNPSPEKNDVLFARKGRDGLIYFRWDGRNVGGQGPFAEYFYGYCYPL